MLLQITALNLSLHKLCVYSQHADTYIYANGIALLLLTANRQYIPHNYLTRGPIRRGKSGGLA